MSDDEYDPVQAEEILDALADVIVNREHHKRAVKAHVDHITLLYAIEHYHQLLDQALRPSPPRR